MAAGPSLGEPRSFTPPEISSRPQKKGHFLYQVFLAVGYIVLIPLVVLSSLMVCTTYFPQKTQEILGLILARVTGTENPELEKVGALEDRVAKIESDLKEVMSRQMESKEQGNNVSPGSSEATRSELDRIASEVDEKSTLLGIISTVTVARMEYLQGNRHKCEQELNAAKLMLEKISLVPQETQDMLGKAIEEVDRGSVQAEDWLSLVWHNLIEAIDAKEVNESQKPGEAAQDITTP